MSSLAVQPVLHLLRLRKAGYFAVRWEVTWLAAPWTLHSAKARGGVPRWIVRPGCGAVERPFSTVPVVTALYHRHWCQVAPSIGPSTLRRPAVESAPPVRQSTTSDIGRFLQDTDLFPTARLPAPQSKREKKKFAARPSECRRRCALPSLCPVHLVRCLACGHVVTCPAMPCAPLPLWHLPRARPQQREAYLSGPPSPPAPLAGPAKQRHAWRSPLFFSGSFSFVCLFHCARRRRCPRADTTAAAPP